MVDKVSFQRKLPRGGFAPVQSADYSSSMEAANRANIQNLRDQKSQVDDQYQQRIRNAANIGRDVEPLAQFSQSLTKALQDQRVRDEKNIQIGKQADFLYDPTQITTEEAAAELDLENAQSAGQTIGEVSGEIQQATGSNVLAQNFRRQFGGLFEGYARQDVDLMNASTMVQPFMSAWMKGNAKVTVNGQTTTVGALVSSGQEDLAFKLGLNQFIEQRGLQYSTKLALVKNLYEPVKNARSQILSGIATTRANQEQEDRQNSVQGTAAAVAGAGRMSPSQVEQLVDAGMTQGAYTTRQQATRSVLDTALRAAALKGDTTTIERLSGFPQSNGLTYGQQYGDLFVKYGADAASASRTAANAADSDAQKAAITTNWAGLDPAAREAEYERQIQNAKDNGLSRTLSNLRSNRDAYLFPGNEDAKTEAELLIDQGVIRTPEQLESYKGILTPAQYQAAQEKIKLDKNRSEIENKELKTTTDKYLKSAQQRLGEVVGLKKNADGTFVEIPGRASGITPDQLALAEGSMKGDLYEITNRILQDSSITNKQEALDKALREWSTRNFETQGGAFYIKDLEDSLREGQGNPVPRTDGQPQQLPLAYTKEQKRRLQQMFGTASLNTISQYEYPLQARPANLTSLIYTNPETRKMYTPSRGDVVIEKGVAYAASTYYQQNGTVPKDVEDVAKLVNQPPLAFLQQQLAAHDLPLVTPQPTNPPQQEPTPSSESSSSGDRPVSEQVDQPSPPPASIKGADRVMGQVPVTRQTAEIFLTVFPDAEAAVSALQSLDPSYMARLANASESQIRAVAQYVIQRTNQGSGGGTSTEGGS